MKPEPLNTEKLHIALGQAIEDLIKASKDPQYKISMGDWHFANEDTGVCSVCLAGATLYREGLTPHQSVQWHELTTPVERMVDALNELRTGHVTEALYYLKQHAPYNYIHMNRFMPAYSLAGFNGYVQALRNLQQDLAKADI